LPARRRSSAPQRAIFAIEDDMDDDNATSSDDLDETALWLRLNHAKVRLAVATEVEERIRLRNEIGDLSQRIRRAQHVQRVKP
jgi:hypothetical protein